MNYLADVLGGIHQGFLETLSGGGGGGGLKLATLPAAPLPITLNPPPKKKNPLGNPVPAVLFGSMIRVCISFLKTFHMHVLISYFKFIEVDLDRS